MISNSYVIAYWKGYFLLAVKFQKHCATLELDLKVSISKLYLQFTFLASKFTWHTCLRTLITFYTLKVASHFTFQSPASLALPSTFHSNFMCSSYFWIELSHILPTHILPTWISMVISNSQELGAMENSKRKEKASGNTSQQQITNWIQVKVLVLISYKHKKKYLEAYP